MDKASLDLLNKKIEKQSKFVLDLKKGIGKVIVGQEELINKILISIISNGHVLLEGVPGLAKTLTINTIANLINADFQRIQFMNFGELTTEQVNLWSGNITIELQNYAVTLET